MSRLGDCVVGSTIANELGIGPGDHLLTDTENFVDILQYPLRLRVAGVLAPSGTVDDGAVFCDIKTVWVIEGIGHGHQDLEKEPPKKGVILERRENEIVAGAALKQYYEITEDNIASFHFHGDAASFPVSAGIVVPRDQRAATLMLARYQETNARLQLVEPSAVVGQLLQTVFRIKQWLDVAGVLVALSTFLLIGLVIVLSLRLREREMVTLFKLGCRRRTTAWLIATELALVAAACVVILLPAVAWAAIYGPAVLRYWVTR